MRMCSESRLVLSDAYIIYPEIFECDIRGLTGTQAEFQL